MTKHYLATVRYEDPYEKEWKETVEAGTPELAMKRAVGDWRKAEYKGRPVRRVSCTVEFLQGSVTAEK